MGGIPSKSEALALPVGQPSSLSQTQEKPLCMRDRDHTEDDDNKNSLSNRFPSTAPQSVCTRKEDESSVNNGLIHSKIPQFPSEQFFSAAFLNHVGKLSSDDMERDIFLKFLFSGLWKKILFQELRYSIMSSTANFLFRYESEVDALNSDSSSTLDAMKIANADLLKDFTKFVRFSELQALFLACSLACFFTHRSQIDFLLDTSTHPASREEIINSLCVRKEEILEPSFQARLEKFLETHQEDDRIIDMEEIFSLVLICSSPEEVDQLVSSGSWHPQCMIALESLSFSICLWDLTDCPLTESADLAFPFPLVYSNRPEKRAASGSGRTSSHSSSSSSRSRRGPVLLKVRDEVDFLRAYFSTSKKHLAGLTAEAERNVFSFRDAVLSRKGWKSFLALRPHDPAASDSSLFFAACPVFVPRTGRYRLLTLHNSAHPVDKLFLQTADILLFCLAGIQSFPLDQH